MMPSRPALNTPVEPFIVLQLCVDAPSDLRLCFVFFKAIVPGVDGAGSL
jgi:hypothetical protein